MKIQTNQPDRGLLLTIRTLRARISDLNLQCKQFADSSAVLMKEKLPREMRDELFSKVVEHLQERDVERSAQYKGVLQTTLMALNETALACTDQKAKQRLIEIIKNLTITIECDSARVSSTGESNAVQS